ncbi:hypothetical protein AAVH_32625 [Aphelenchoides avenae]|nr:hypothetical protein AAVH_32625 [Aphelenchus avenae]
MIQELPYIPKTSDQLGSMVVQDGHVVKAEGELANAERFATVLVKLVNVGTSDAIAQNDEPFTTITLQYPAYFYVVAVSGRWICCVKRRVTAPESSAAPLPTGPPGFEAIPSDEASA